jgi:hypothetical protein
MLEINGTLKELHSNTTHAQINVCLIILNDLDEYEVHLFSNDEYYEADTYFTDDLGDARDTAQHMCLQGGLLGAGR